MTDEPITTTMISVAVSCVALAFTGWWRIENRIKPLETEMRALKELLLTDYVSINRFEKVEMRLLEAIEKLTEKIEQLSRRMPGRRVENPE